jgi:hypothetical protein
MSPETSEAIERWLFEQGRRWVSVEEACNRWDISERRLRFLGAGFLVSRQDGGYLHRFHATPAELEAYCGPKQAHAITELKNIKRLRLAYREGRRPGYPADPTGQLLIV